MATIKGNRATKFISTLFSDENLTKKAYLNAFASALDYAARLLIGFFITPLVVVGLGDFFYGVWQFLNRLVGYISPSSGKPTMALKWTLASMQNSTDYDLKRQQVGNTLAILAIFTPLLAILGGLMTWFVPFWLKAPPEYFWQVRVAAALLVLELIATSLATIPQSVLQGENISYKRMGATTIMVLVGGGLTWLAIVLKTGIVGVAAAAVISMFLSGGWFLLVVRQYAPWFGVGRPTRKSIMSFMGISWWFMGWNLVSQVMTDGDVVLLGLLGAVTMVADYTLTKYAPDMLISIIAIMVFGSAPGLGGILGSGDYEKAARVRGEMMALTWLIVTVMGGTILTWNQAFLSLWVGAQHFTGVTSALLMVVMVTQMVIIRNDASVIDLTLKINRKVTIGAISSAVSLILAGVLVKVFNLGIAGLCIGLIAGRLILSIAYPMLIGRFLKVSFANQIKSSIRPIVVSIILYVAAALLTSSVFASTGKGIQAWALLVLGAAITGLGMLAAAFFIGLTQNQRSNILMRIRVILNRE
jgi:O-antigen/teichoic acid export membrane protein